MKFWRRILTISWLYRFPSFSHFSLYKIRHLKMIKLKRYMYKGYRVPLRKDFLIKFKKSQPWNIFKMLFIIFYCVLWIFDSNSRDIKSSVLGWTEILNHPSWACFSDTRKEVKLISGVIYLVTSTWKKINICRK